MRGARIEIKCFSGCRVRVYIASTQEARIEILYNQQVQSNEYDLSPRRERELKFVITYDVNTTTPITPTQGARIEIPMFEKIKLINHIAPHERSEN